jgi:hypothetical protein
MMFTTLPAEAGSTVYFRPSSQAGNGGQCRAAGPVAPAQSLSQQARLELERLENLQEYGNYVGVRRIAAKIRVANDATLTWWGFKRRCATQRSGQMPDANEVAAKPPCRSNNEAGDRDRRAVWSLASHLTATHIVFVQGRRTQGFAVLSGEVTPTYRCPELALSGRGARRWQQGFTDRRSTNCATAVGRSAAPRSAIAS